MTTPRLLSERYELGDVLGYGGMSEVHRGLDTRLGRDVAVKVLRADLARDPQFQMRFRREAQNAASLNHPAIVSVYDTGETQSEFGPLPYIVMEYVDGQTLREIVKTQGPMTQQKVIEVMADVCAALDFSHRHNIIHRDVKPANIMINRAGAVKVMDFGIARALGEGQNVTQTAAVIGTAQYLSPEQARGEPVDARSDVYASGCVLFELLTGDPPFTGDTPVAVAYQHVREDPRRPSEINPSIPPALDAVVLKALSKNPLNRYQSAAEMRSDLVRVRTGQAPMAPQVMSEDERTAMLAPPMPTGPTRRINGTRHAAAPASYGEYYDDEPRRSPARMIAWTVGAVAVLGLLVFAATQLFFRSPPAPQPVAVPNVVGQTEQVARNQIISTRLQVAPEAVQVTSSVEEIGLVVGTDPGINSQVPERTVVTLQVGKGPERTTVPRLQGQTAEEAEATLKTRALTLGEQTEEETDNAELVGKVVRTEPEAGEDVAGQSAVKIFIGKERTTAQIPNVAGQSVQGAQQLLAQSGFTNLQQTPVPNAQPAGTVLATDPAAGTQARKDATITLQVSDGSGGNTGGGQVDVPDLRGQDLGTARQQLQQRGFATIQVVNIPAGDESQRGKVVDQSPRNGKADPSQPITLVVARGSGDGGDGN
jgi:eukaryotic-like serine/threonine-protein kinase